MINIILTSDRSCAYVCYLRVEFVPCLGGWILIVYARTGTITRVIAVAAGIWLVCAPASIVAQEVRTLEPVWILTIDGNRALVTKNEFLKPPGGWEQADSTKTFPVPSLRISKVIRPITELRVHGSSERGYARAAPIFINAAGQITPSELVLIPPRSVSFGRAAVGASILDDPSHRSDLERMRGVPGRIVSYPDFKENKLWAWTKANDVFGIMHLANGTWFFDPSSGRLLSKYNWHVYAVVFARDRPLMAAASGDKKSFSKIVVFDFEGRLVYESDESELDYRQPYLAPSGNWLMSERALHAERYDQVHLNVTTGEISILGKIPVGARYHSRDGRFVLVVHQDIGKAYYFDITRPTEPVRLWEYDAGQIIMTASVSFDGRFVGLQTFDRASRSRGVSVLDRSMNLVARTAFGYENGIEFVGEYLFVGEQWHPVDPRETTTVYLYYLRGLEP